jgi:hypothetical protein
MQAGCPPGDPTLRGRSAAGKQADVQSAPPLRPA